MTNLLRSHPGDATQSEIVILRALESFAEPANLAKQGSAIYAKMVEVGALGLVHTNAFREAKQIRAL